MDIVIVGGGPAGFHAALQSRQCWPEKSVALIEGESTVGYCRPLLPQFMAGEVKEEKLSLFKPGEDPLLKVSSGVWVQSLDRQGQTLHLGSGERIKYERLILAPGGRPMIPRIEGMDGLEGVFPVRNLPEAQKVRNWITRDQKIIVLGGGLVGVKTGVYLRASGFQVSIVEKEGHLLPQALKADAARRVESHLEGMGMNLYLGQTLEALEGADRKMKRAKVGGNWLSCHTLLLAVGSVPNISFLESSGLLEDGMLLASPALQTRDPRIFAAGDAVTISLPDKTKCTPWTWPQAVSQGKLAAANLYRSQPVPLKALTRVNSMNLQGLFLNLLGAFAEGSKEISYSPPGAGILRQVFLKEGRIAGGALVGDITGAGPLHHLMIQGKDSGTEALRFIKPSFSLIPRSLLEKGVGRRRARLFREEENPLC